MKKVISTIGILVLVLLCFAAPAYAATIQLESDPATITAAGNINLKFTVTNDSSFTMRSMRIRGYGISDSDNTLAPFTVYPSSGITFNSKNVPITQEMLGTTIVYTFYWTENDEEKYQEIPLALGGAPGQTPPTMAEMTATRTASKQSGNTGEKITLTYTLRNPSSVSMTNVSISDPIAGTSPVQSGITIAAGDSHTATYEYTLGSADAISEPTITYTINGENKTLRINSETIAVVSVKLTATVTMADPTAEGVLFTIVLKNDGNTTIENISVKDDLGAAVNASSVTLQSGQESLLTHTILADAARVVSFTITGTDSTGQPYEDKTESFTISPYVDPSSVSFQLFTQVLQNLDENGSMQIRFTIQNASSVDIRDAVITESVLGDVIQPLSILPAGETVKEATLQVGQARELNFTLRAKDPSGVEHTYSSSVTASLAVANSPTPPPATPDADEPTRAPMSDTLVTVLIVLAVLMALAGIALLVLSIYERKRNAEMEALDADGYTRMPRAQNAAAGYAGKEEQPRPSRKERKQNKRDQRMQLDDDYDDIRVAKPRNAVARQQDAPVQDVRQTRVTQPTPPAHSYAVPAQEQRPVNQAQTRQPKPVHSGVQQPVHQAQNNVQQRPQQAADQSFRPMEPERMQPMRFIPEEPVPFTPMRAEPYMPQTEGRAQFAEPPSYPSFTDMQTERTMEAQVYTREPEHPAHVRPVEIPPETNSMPERPRPAVEPPIAQTPQWESAWQVPTQPTAPVPVPPPEVQMPVVETPAPVAEPPLEPIPQPPQRAQAAGSVRNKIHRVRPKDD